MTNSGLYKIVNKINGKFYIGSTDNFHRRFSRHKLDLKNNRHDNKHFQNAWNKYGEQNFIFEIYKLCDATFLLMEEQKELDVWFGNDLCYNLSKVAGQPVAIGEPRSEEVKQKISIAQKGKPRWTEEQKKQMSIDRIGQKHNLVTIAKFEGRSTSFENIQKAQEFNDGRVYSNEHCLNISVGKKNKYKKFSKQELENILNGVQKARSEGRCHKNKVPRNEYETIKGLYLSGKMNKRKLAMKYGIAPSSMAKLLKRVGI